MNNDLICALCEKRDTLLKTHLIPKFLYSALTKKRKTTGLLYYDKRNKIHRNIPMNQIVKPLLCKSCECLFANNGEKWFSGILKNKEYLFALYNEIYSYQKNTNSPVPSIDILPNDDSLYFKYFIMSIIFRAAFIWKEDKFKEVKIANENLLKIKKFLLTKEEAVLSEGFHIMCLIDKRYFEDIKIIFPQTNSKGYVIFYFFGFYFIFFQDKKINSNDILSFGLEPHLFNKLSEKLNNINKSSCKSKKAPAFYAF